MSERRAKGLCMFCDEPFTPGHHLKHRRSQMMVMELEGNDDSNEEEPENEPVLQEITTPDPETPQMSLQALTGVATYQTMHVKGLYNKKALQILLDSGSTHNFLDINMARKLGCRLEEVTPMAITGGGGHKLEAPYICKGFVWSMHNHEFSADVIVSNLVGLRSCIWSSMLVAARCN